MALKPLKWVINILLTNQIRYNFQHFQPFVDYNFDIYYSKAVIIVINFNGLVPHRIKYFLM